LEHCPARAPTTLRFSMASNNILVGLGNPIMSDDGVGLLVCRRLHRRLAGYDLDLACGAGLHVLDSILGYRRAVIVDSMVTGRFPVGSVVRVDPHSGPETRRAGHSHGMGFFEAMEIARACRVSLPEEIFVYGIEVENPYSIGEGVSEGIGDKIDEIVDFIVEDLAGEEA
jgi:hydrogenase maturation protease